jgi:hypothetical protein
LVQLGFEHVWLGLQAEQAQKAQDLTGELRARHALARLLPSGEPGTLASLRAYASLLERLCLFEEAEAIEARIRLVDPDHFKSGGCDQADRLKDADSILQPDQPLPILIEAATILGLCFSKRCCVRELEPLACRGFRMSADQVAGKYEHVRSEHARANLPNCQIKSIWWVSRSQVRLEDTLVLLDETHSPVEGLGLAYQIRHDGLQTVVVPAVMFDAGRVGPDHDTHEHNRQVSAALEQLQPRSLAETWLAKVDQAVTQALRRLITQSLSHRPEKDEVE